MLEGKTDGVFVQVKNKIPGSLCVCVRGKGGGEIFSIDLTFVCIILIAMIINL